MIDNITNCLNTHVIAGCMRVIGSSACLCTADAVRPTVLLLYQYRQLRYIRPDKLLISILHSAESPAASWALCCSCELFVLCLSSHLPLPVSSCLPSPPFHPPLTSSDLLSSFHFPLTLSASLLLDAPPQPSLFLCISLRPLPIHMFSPCLSVPSMSSLSCSTSRGE